MKFYKKSLRLLLAALMVFSFAAYREEKPEMTPAANEDPVQME